MFKNLVWILMLIGMCASANIQAYNYRESRDVILQRIELNEASKEELCKLPRIGPKKADKIIAYREKHRFTRLTQLLNIKGIGPKTLKNFRHMIYLKARMKVKKNIKIKKKT